MTNIFLNTQFIIHNTVFQNYLLKYSLLFIVTCKYLIKNNNFGLKL